MKLPFILPVLQSASARFEAQSPRERLLMIAAFGALFYFVADAAVLTPQLREQRQLRAQTEIAQAETQRLNQQIAELSARLASNNGTEREAELAALRQIIAEADALLSENDGGSLRLSALLSSMLRTTSGLKLMSLKTLPVVPLLPRTGPKAADGSDLRPAPPITGSANAIPDPPPVAVYQHAVEIAIQGNYLALLPYLEKIRRYPRRLFWTSASLEVIEHPVSVLRLTITTLSEQQMAPLE